MKTEELAGGTLDTLTPDEVAEMLAKNEIVLIDVRTPQEYMFERVRGALLAPMHGIEPGSLPGQAEKRVVFHCGSGARSRKVAERCLGAGYTHLAHMEGGFGGWKAAGLPYIGTDMATGAPKEVTPEG